MEQVKLVEQRTNLNALVVFAAEQFLRSRKAANLAAGTVEFYRDKMRLWLTFCDTQAIGRVEQVTPDDIRGFLLWLEGQGHNPGGIHAAFRALRSFLFWWEEETEPDGWKNPIRKVKAPKVALEPLAGVEPSTVRALVDICQRGTFTGSRDKAILMFLLDSGLRAAELLALNLADVDTVTGAVFVRQGKGRKPRTVFVGRRTRQAVRAYLRHREDKNPALFLTGEGERLRYDGLRSLVNRRSRQAGITPPKIHDFRRGFALNCLRAGMDVITIQKLLGHSDLQVLRRYLAQTDGDLQAAHSRASPVDTW